MNYLYLIAVIAVVGGHFLFAYGQWFRWLDVCKKLTDLSEEEAKNTEALGRSFASYNASIGVGICLSFFLPEAPRDWAQGVVLALIIITAAVGVSGTKGNSILVKRLIPAVVALVFLILK